MIKVRHSITGQDITPRIFKFPAGELQVEFFSDGFKSFGSVNITMKNITSDDIIALMQISEVLKRNKIAVNILEIPYMPCSRMDRPIAQYSFSLKVLADLINSVEAKQVITLDAHSTACDLLINNLQNQDPYDYQMDFFTHIGTTIGINIINPDAGASKKYNSLKERCKDVIQALKYRDFNGNILNTEVFCKDLNGTPCVVLDDICDGGTTFIELAKVLKAKNAGKLYLFVTHGIFSKGIEELGKYYEVIGCTDSFGKYEWADKHLTNFKVFK